MLDLTDERLREIADVNERLANNGMDLDIAALARAMLEARALVRAREDDCILPEELAAIIGGKDA